MNQSDQLKRLFASLLFILMISEGFSYKVSGRFVREHTGKSARIQFLISDGKKFSKDYTSDLDKGFLIENLKPGKYFIRYVNNYYQGFEIPVHIIDKNILGVDIPYQEFDYDLNPLKMAIETINIGEEIVYEEKVTGYCDYPGIKTVSSLTIRLESAGYRATFSSIYSTDKSRFLSLSELQPLIEFEERIRRIAQINKKIPNSWNDNICSKSTDIYSFKSSNLSFNAEMSYCINMNHTDSFQDVVEKLFAEKTN